MNRNTGNKYTKIVEWHLFREKEIRQAVMEARLDSASSGNSSGKVISNPTENAALRNIAPLAKVVLSDGAEVFRPEEWLIAIKRIYGSLDGEQRALAESRYRNKRQYFKDCQRGYISKSKYYTMLDRIKSHAVAVAVQAGLIRVY